MRTAYQRLLRVRVRHTYYPDGHVCDDFALRPAPATRLLARRGVVLRPLADGFAVYAEVVPGSSPPRLARPLDPSRLRFVFACLARNPPLLGITELPAHQPARTVFVFDNLRDDAADGRLHLGDCIAAARIGSPLPLVTGGMLSHPLGAPASVASLALTDRFGRTRWSATLVLSDDGHPATEARVDLASLPALTPGRYTMSDDRGGRTSFYYAPDLAVDRPFAIVEVFADTSALTADGSNAVPASYRFVAGDLVAAGGDYWLEFQPRATTWRYRIAKKYDRTNGVALADLGIDGAVPFNKTVTQDLATFTSSSPVRLRMKGPELKLMLAGARLRTLPSPGMSTPLARAPTPGEFVSEMFLNV